MGASLTPAPYRHISVAIAREHIPAQLFPGGEKVFDHALAHSTNTGRSMYGLDEDSLPTLTTDAVWEYRALSEEWHRVLGVHELPPRKALRLSMKSKEPSLDVSMGDLVKEAVRVELESFQLANHAKLVETIQSAVRESAASILRELRQTRMSPPAHLDPAFSSGGGNTALPEHSLERNPEIEHGGDVFKPVPPRAVERLSQVMVSEARARSSAAALGQSFLPDIGESPQGALQPIPPKAAERLSQVMMSEARARSPAVPLGHGPPPDIGESSRDALQPIPPRAAERLSQAMASEARAQSPTAALGHNSPPDVEQSPGIGQPESSPAEGPRRPRQTEVVGDTAMMDSTPDNSQPRRLRKLVRYGDQQHSLEPAAATSPSLDNLIDHRQTPPPLLEPEPTDSLESIALNAIREALGNDNATAKSPEQMQALIEILDPGSTADIDVVLPTGGGKSLLWQAAAFGDPEHGSAIVIPYKMLLEQQLASSKRAGVVSCSFKAGDNPPQGVQNIFVQPESAKSRSFLQ
jgi:hypothetical protein